MFIEKIGDQMPEKVDSDVIKKKRSRLKKKLERANQISIQMKVLEELGKRKMTRRELREYVESLGGDFATILPILKNSGLVRAERIDTGQRGRTYVYSLIKT